jgi:3'(2'), 5'-bisphosphate nucleotidase
MDYQKEWQTALEASRLASEVLQEEYQRFTQIANAPADITTEADRRSQETIIQYLHSQFPNDSFCGEEDTPALARAGKTGPRAWIIDPIDGTRGFARKNGEFSIMIAFMDRASIIVGVVAEPALPRTTYAVRGQGCWVVEGNQQARRCRVREVQKLSDAVLTQSRSKSADVPSTPVALLKPARVVETYSAGIKLALVARGEADVYVNTYEAFHDWDICAGQILVEEAGGQVTGIGGQAIRYGTEGAWQRDGLLGTNGQLHQEIIEILRGKL